QGGEVPVGARVVQVQPQPVPDPELLPARRRQGRAGAARQQDDRHDLQGPRRRLRAGLPDEVVSAASGSCMSGILILEQFLNGLQFGLMLFLLAAGLTLVSGIMDMINLAHGSLYMVGAFLAAALVQATGSFTLGVLLAVPATAALGMLLEMSVLRAL